MGKASNRKKNCTGFPSALTYNGLTVYRTEGVNPKHGMLVIKAIQSIYQDDVAGAKSHVGALERHGVSIFDFQMGLDNIAFGIPQCACAWALSTDARGAFSWLTQKAFDEGGATNLPFFQRLLYEIDSCPATSGDFPRIEFAMKTFIACFVSGRAQEALDTIPQGIGPRARAILINEAQREAARVAQIELNACIPPQKPLATGEPSTGEMATATGPRRL